jgi:hypothetical protein
VVVSQQHAARCDVQELEPAYAHAFVIRLARMVRPHMKERERALFMLRIVERPTELHIGLAQRLRLTATSSSG